jgi:hypothetical protein
VTCARAFWCRATMSVSSVMSSAFTSPARQQQHSTPVASGNTHHTLDCTNVALWNGPLYINDVHCMVQPAKPTVST